MKLALENLLLTRPYPNLFLKLLWSTENPLSDFVTKEKLKNNAISFKTVTPGSLARLGPIGYGAWIPGHPENAGDIWDFWVWKRSIYVEVNEIPHWTFPKCAIYFDDTWWTCHCPFYYFTTSHNIWFRYHIISRCHHKGLFQGSTGPVWLGPRFSVPA